MLPSPGMLLFALVCGCPGAASGSHKHDDDLQSTILLASTKRTVPEGRGAVDPEVWAAMQTAKGPAIPVLRQLLVHVVPGSVPRVQEWWSRGPGAALSQARYLPHNTLVVLAGPAAVLDASKHPDVVWIGRMRQRDKLADSARARGAFELRASLLAPVSPAAVRAALGPAIARRVSISFISQLQLSVAPLARGAPIPRGAATALATLERVHWVEGRSTATAMNAGAAESVQAPPGSSPSTPIWDKQIRGQGEIIGVHDTGVDLTHCFFAEDVNGSPVTSCTECTRGIQGMQANEAAYDTLMSNEAFLRNASNYYDNEELSGEGLTPLQLRDAVVAEFYEGAAAVAPGGLEKLCRAAEIVTSARYFGTVRTSQLEVRFAGGGNADGYPAISRVEIVDANGVRLSAMVQSSSGVAPTSPDVADDALNAGPGTTVCYAGARGVTVGGVGYAWLRADLFGMNDVASVRVYPAECASVGNLTRIEIRALDESTGAFRIVAMDRELPSNEGIEYTFSNATLCSDACGRSRDGVCSDGLLPNNATNASSPTQQPTQYPTVAGAGDPEPASCTFGTDCQDCGMRSLPDAVLAAARLFLRRDRSVPCPMALVPASADNATCAFSSSACTSPDLNKRKVVAHWAYADAVADIGSHGTHVAGSVLGAPADANSPATRFQGVAPDARLVFSDGGYTGTVQTDSFPRLRADDDDAIHVPPVDRLFGFAYGMGARIHVNGWGTGAPSNGGYSQAAADIDAYVEENDDMLIVFAAGNGGWRGVTAEAASKNALSVGATSQFRQYEESTAAPLDVAATRRAWSRRICDSPFARPTPLAVEVQQELEAEALCAAELLVNNYDMSGYCISDVVAEATWTAVCALDAASSPPQSSDCRNWALRRRLTPRACTTGNTTGFYGNDTVAEFSARGPTPDGRLKPDLVAPGNRIVSAYSGGPLESSACDASTNSEQPLTLGVKRGTSMASGVAAGAAALVRQYLRQGYSNVGRLQEFLGMTKPSSALLKAMLIAGAREVRQWNGTQVTAFDDVAAAQAVGGFGAIDLSNVLQFRQEFASTPFGLKVLDRQLATADGLASPSTSMYYRLFQKIPGASFKAVLCWVDPPALPSAAKALVNDLDLIMTDFNPAEPTNLASNYTVYGNARNESDARDSRNNVEVVDLSTVCPRCADNATGGEYVRVWVRGSQLNQGTEQNFSLVVLGGVDVTDSWSLSPTADPTHTPTTSNPLTSTPSTVAPTGVPTGVPTGAPTGTPSATPLTSRPTTGAPTETLSPSLAPSSTFTPTVEPTSTPTTLRPTTMAPITTRPTTVGPSAAPSATTHPSTQGPTTQFHVTPYPSLTPTTAVPTVDPTMAPVCPTTTPTTSRPITAAPMEPTASWGTENPSATTISPTPAPTTIAPTLSPTIAPTPSPTSFAPTLSPATAAPSSVPTSSAPTLTPTTPKPNTYCPSMTPLTWSPSTANPTHPTSQPLTEQPIIITICPSVTPVTFGPTNTPVTATPTTGSPTVKIPTAAPTASPQASEGYRHVLRGEVLYATLDCGLSSTVEVEWRSAVAARTGLFDPRIETSTSCGSVRLVINMVFTGIDMGGVAAERMHETRSGMVALGIEGYFNTTAMWSAFGAPTSSSWQDLGNGDADASTSSSANSIVIAVGVVCGVVAAAAIGFWYMRCRKVREGAVEDTRRRFKAVQNAESAVAMDDLRPPSDDTKGQEDPAIGRIASQNATSRVFASQTQVSDDTKGINFESALSEVPHVDDEDDAQRDGRRAAQKITVVEDDDTRVEIVLKDDGQGGAEVVL